jgi:hypothetical protein
MALTFFGDPVAPVRYALSISRALEEYPLINCEWACTRVRYSE